MTFGITAWGGYIPRLRLERGAIAAQHAWMAPSLKGLAKGRRAYCSWDEDIVTMAVEAARNCLGTRDRSAIKELRLASTTAPSADLQSSAIVAVALRLSHDLQVMDVGGSQRAGVAALVAALRTGREPTLVIASERPRATPASTQEMQYGAGAAAFLIGDDNVAAEIVGSASATTLLVDHFRAAGAAHDYFWEERWIRDEGYAKVGGGTVKKALADAGVAGADVTKLIFPAPGRGVGEMVAKAAGIAPTAVADALDADGGFTGTAHSLLMLANVLDTAAPGDVIVVAGFGQGSDVVVLRATDAIASGKPARTVADLQAAGASVTAYGQMASFYDEVELEWGMRAERDTKTALTEQYRSSDQVNGFVAGQCGSCGQIQYPQLAYCVSCRTRADDFVQVPLADEGARVLTYTADSLMYHPAPPLYAGFAQFDNGARLLMEFVDVSADDFDVGKRLEMRFRIKEKDVTRGYYRYFWKAAPVAA
jgi:3-hydroxy-3-methylglutaryl CoA synthase